MNRYTAVTSKASVYDVLNTRTSEKKGDAAEQALTQAKNDLSADPRAYRMLGDYYLSIGEGDKALNEFASLSKEHPEDLTIRKNYIELLLRHNRQDEAATLNDEILKKNGKDADALLFRGQMQLAQNKPQDAMRSLEAALKSEPNGAMLRYELGQAAAATGDLTRAETEWREAAKQRPNLVKAQSALAALAFVDLGDGQVRALPREGHRHPRDGQRGDGERRGGRDEPVRRLDHAREIDPSGEEAREPTGLVDAERVMASGPPHVDVDQQHPSPAVGREDRGRRGEADHHDAEASEVDRVLAVTATARCVVRHAGSVTLFLAPRLAPYDGS